MDKKTGSLIAKRGFKREIEVSEKFKNWKTDNEAKRWLEIMGYDLREIENIVVKVIRNHKTDLQIQILRKKQDYYDIHNIQIKSVNMKKGFNQVDKRWIDHYRQMWNIPEDVTKILKYFTGEIKPYTTNVKDPRRMFINELKLEEQNKLLKFFQENKILVICDLIIGKGPFSTEWILVVQTTDNTRWTLQPVNKVIDYYAKGDVSISPKGGLKIGKINMQRKGGDKGRKSAQMLQFKLNPAKIFDI